MRRAFAIYTIFFFIAADFTVAGLFLVDENADDLIFRTRHPCYHHALRENVSCTDTWAGVEYEMRTNSLGFKDRSCRPVAGTSAAWRVLLLGDSFTEGIGVCHDSTFAGLLAKHHPEAEILNGGVASYSPRLYYLKAKHLVEGRNLRLDELVVFIDISDIQDEVIYRGFECSEGRLSTPPLEGLYVFLVNNSVLWNRFFRLRTAMAKKRSEAIMAAKSLGYGDYESFWDLRANWTSDPGLWGRWAAEGMSLAKANMGLLHALCERHGLRLTVVIYPWIRQMERNETTNLHVSSWEDFCQAKGIRLVNLFPDLLRLHNERGVKDLYLRDETHWNSSGHAMIFKLLEQHGLLAQAPPQAGGS